MTRVSLRAVLAAELAGYQRDGYYLARGLFSAEEVAELRDTFMTMAANGPVEGLSETKRGNVPLGYDRSDPLHFYPRMMHPHRHLDKPVGPVAWKYMLHPRVGAILTDLFGEEPIAAQSMFYFKPPGARGQDFHQDNFYLRVKPGTCMAAWTALDKTDLENGGMLVVPGSHKLDLLCPEPANQEEFFTTEHVAIPAGATLVPALMEPGDVLFFNGAVIHGSYRNKSQDRFRRSFICHYAPQSCHEIGLWYRPLYDLNGREVVRAESTLGGPCGTPAVEKSPH